MSKEFYGFDDPDFNLPPEVDDECPNCGGEGLVFGCFEDCCSGADCDELGCAPSRCDWCRPRKPAKPDPV